MDFSKRAKIISATVTAVVTVAVIMLLLMLYLRSTADEPRIWPPEDTSELLLAGEFVQYGDVPRPDLSDNKPAEQAEAEPAEPSEDIKDAGTPAPDPAPVLSSKVESPVKVKETPKPEKTGPTKEELAEMERVKKEKEAAKKISSRVKFGGTSTSASSQEGGKSGSPNGNATAGALKGQPGAQLKGRTLSSWSMPSATAIGMIKIRVRVGRNGKVIASEYYQGTGPVASIEAARRSCEQAALRSTFSVDNDAEAEQVGYISYKFE
ncbi:MAG: hypothetical protein HFJ94_04520 [Muribaculaceae bacterium]|nr:hypothetical protein [Muribaculaceae bacterium]